MMIVLLMIMYHHWLLYTASQWQHWLLTESFLLSFKPWNITTFIKWLYVFSTCYTLYIYCIYTVYIYIYISLGFFSALCSVDRYYSHYLHFWALYSYFCLKSHCISSHPSQNNHPYWLASTFLSPPHRHVQQAPPSQFQSPFLRCDIFFVLASLLYLPEWIFFRTVEVLTIHLFAQWTKLSWATTTSQTSRHVHTQVLGLVLAPGANLMMWCNKVLLCLPPQSSSTTTRFTTGTLRMSASREEPRMQLTGTFHWLHCQSELVV